MVDLQSIQQAAERIRPVIHRTPVMTSRLFNEATGVQAFFKCENFQRGGAFKFRGAANFLSSMKPEDRARGVVAFSSGNHAQAVAIAAAHFGISATIVMPDDAPVAKLEATRAYGARIILYDRLREDREAIGRKLAEESGCVLIPPYDHEWIIAGQGTAVIELLEEVPALDAVLVCVGGGGLFAGSLIAGKGLQPSLKMWGVEPELANDTWLSLEKGERVATEPSTTIADGLRAVTPGAITFPIVKSLADGVLLVSEDEIRHAVSFVATRMKIVAEPSGAVTPAALLAHKMPAGPQRIGILISGGNV